MFKSFRHITLLMMVFLLFGLGCKGATTEELTMVRPRVINYWTVFGDIQLLRQLANEYNSLRPYVKVQIRQVRYEEFEKLFVNALADGVAPDIISLHIRDLPRHQSRLMSMPKEVKVADVTVTEGINKQTIVVPRTFTMPTAYSIRETYLSTVGEDVVIGGKIYGLPLAIDTLALYYNEDLLNKSGIAEPPKTWIEFSDAVKKSTKFDAEEKLIQSGTSLGLTTNIDNYFDILSVLMMQNGLKIEDRGYVSFVDSRDSNVQNSPALSALRFYTDFARRERDTYTWDATRGDALEEFSRGRSVFYLGYSYDRQRIALLGPQLKYRVVELPQLNPDSPANVANYWVETVVGKTKSINESWDFLRYISSPANIIRYTDKTGQISPLRSQVANQLNNPLIAPFAKQALIARNWYHGRDSVATSQAFADLINGSFLPPARNSSESQRDGALFNRASAQIQETY